MLSVDLIEEFEWIIITLREIDEGSRYLPATRVSHALIEIREGRVKDPWEIIASHFSK